MKLGKIILIGLFGISILWGMNKLDVFAEEYKEVNNVLTINKTYETAKIINENSYAYTFRDESYLISGTKKIELGVGCIKSVLETNANYYIVLYNNGYKIIKYNLKNENLASKELKDFTFNDWIFDEYLIIIGEKNNDAVMYLLTTELVIKKEYSYGGEENECFNHLVKLNDEYFITGLKSGISKNSPFINNGSASDVKSFIARFDDEFGMIDVLYLNENSSYEAINSIVAQNNNLVLLLEVTDKAYLYNINDDFKVCDYFETNNNYSLLVNNKNENYLVVDKMGSIYEINDGNNYLVNNIESIDLLYDYKVLRGVFYYFYNYDEYTYLEKLSEYDVIRNEEIYCDRLYYNEFNLEGFECLSYFEEYDFYFDETSIDRLMAGCFKSYVKTLRSDGTYLKIEVARNIQRFTNFIDGGIYVKGKVLEFFGYGYIDDEICYYGTTLNECGTYDLKIMNGNGNFDYYHLYIVDDYYTNHKIENVPYTYESYVGEDVSISYDIKTDVENFNIINLYVNESIYDDYQLDDRKLTINFKTVQKNSLKHYYIDKFTYLDDNNNMKTYFIGKHIIINYRKRPLEYLENDKLENNYIEFDYEITDIDQSFLYLKVINGNNEEIIFNNKEISLSENNNNIFYLVYTDGIKVFEKELFNYQTLSRIESRIIMEYENERLTSLSINVDVPSDYGEMIKLTKSDINLETYYLEANQVDLLKIVIMISVCLVIGCFSLFFIIFIIKKKKTHFH